jgi:hypothetical protein
MRLSIATMSMLSAAKALPHLRALSAFVRLGELADRIQD